jgi:hypothetical protein
MTARKNKHKRILRALDDGNRPFAQAVTAMHLAE